MEFIGEVIGYLIAFGVGLGCGSYATMPYYRLPNKEPCAGRWIGKKSHCTSCNHQLRTRDLVPVFNWLLTHGKCQFCGYKVNPVYFFIEFTVMVLSILIFNKFGFEGLYFYIIILGAATCIVILTATDFTYQVMPWQVLIVMILFGCLYHKPEDLTEMVNVFVLAALLSLFYSKKIHSAITGRELENYAYLQFICASSIWFSYLDFFLYLLIAGVISMLIPLLNSILKWKLKYGIAFTASFMITILYYDKVFELLLK